MPFGKIAGLAIGIFLAYFLILPDDILDSLRSTPMPLTDLLRVFAAFIITIASVVFGHYLDAR